MSTFPLISHISDVLPHIKGKSEFRVTEKGWYTVVIYSVPLTESFTVQGDWYGNMVRRECRGLIFDTESGKLIRRGYHKFFNLGELRDVQYDFGRKHIILEKLDGSMVTGFRGKEGGYRLATKAGVTDTSMRAEEYAKLHPQYGEFIDLCLNAGHTPIFEWCSRKDRIVEDYGPGDSLILTAVRDMLTGQYLEGQIDTTGIPVVREVDTTPEVVKSWEKGEGIVIRFEDGEMVKVKADAYVKRHRSMSLVRSEDNILSLILNDEIDDVMPLLSDSDAERVRGYRDKVLACIDNVAAKAEDLYKAGIRLYPDKKNFAVQYVQRLSEHPGFAPILYQLHRSGGLGARDIVLEFLRKESGRWILS
jgi:T4 RnlA family RNA ligase